MKKCEPEKNDKPPTLQYHHMPEKNVTRKQENPSPSSHAKQSLITEHEVPQASLTQNYIQSLQIQI